MGRDEEETLNREGGRRRRRSSKKGRKEKKKGGEFGRAVFCVCKRKHQASDAERGDSKPLRSVSSA